ncbi:unnamed protein product [Diatraea saccharalis]|uniref:Hemolin n=1 Tax=Diatraea saccharalis TaxID=40085 RepID=A0A9P0G155_9NEOP|nr:unnamed protein product [Diatraea saccharalis]
MARPQSNMGSKRLILFLLLNFLTSAVSFNCPPKCNCTHINVRCIQQGLVSVPILNTDIHTLDVRFNKIVVIKPLTFVNLRMLRSLLLNDNQIRELISGTFAGLRRLKFLYLYRNRINHVDEDVFNALPHLEQLYLQVNEIHQIDPQTFTNMPRLQRLYLHNNKLNKIPPGSFRGLTKLHKLRLDSNALICDCSMKWFVKMINEHDDMEILATCYSPADTTGSSLSSMKPDDFHCYKPEILLEPTDAVVYFGDNVGFTCVATGDPEPEIVWYRDSEELEISETSRYELMYNGTLMIHDVDESSEGVFECMAKNSMGEAKSKPARMVVQNRNTDTKLQFTALPANRTIKLPEPFVSFDCDAVGKPNPHITWFLNDKKIVLTDKISIKKNGTIVIHNVELNDRGNYTCLAENIHGKITASADLQIFMAPAFVIVPKDIITFYGDKVTFTCKVQGVPTPRISWYKDNFDLTISENVFLDNNNETLKILEVSEDDEGTYSCEAENIEGIIKISAILSIREFKVITPRIVLKPEDMDAYKGTSIQMPCEVESEPPAVVEWSKDGSRIGENDRMTISLIGSLIINNLTVTDTGRYECTVFNNYGRDTASIFLTVKNHDLPSDEYVNIAIVQATRDVDQAIARTVDNLFSKDRGKGTRVDINDLYRITRFPNAPERELARAAEIYERTLDKVKEYTQNGLSVTSAEPFNYEVVLSAQHLEIIGRLSGCVAHREKKDCSDMCFHTKYRSIDGSCNNFVHPTWGASLTGFRRILFAIYENGFSQPLGWNRDRKYNGFTLPPARLISTEIITTTEISQDEKLTHMVMQWGQWLDHDLDHALPSVSSQTWDGVDCKKTCDYAAPCFPIDVPADDPRVTNRRCIDFIRTSAVCGSGMTSVLFGKLQPREQINQLTSYIDASQVYGFDQQVADDLRDYTSDSGLLRVGATFPGKKPLLPTTGVNAMDCRRNLAESTRSCFVAGDIRANEQIGLAAMHTIWMREHNRIAIQLKSLNPQWDGNKVYQEARKVVGAEIQLITYEHWLPLILGQEGFKQLGTYSGYKSDINPSISNVFATAALRFGHSMINPILHRYDENFETIPQGHLMLRDAFFSPWRLVDEGGVDPLIRGMFTTPAKLKTPTQNLNSELTEKLFYSSHAVALDLAAINIQRGRDHGIPPYTKFRQFCNMSEVESFEDLANEIPDKTVRGKLKRLYGSVHNIDVWVGGILETQVDGGKVGPLFKCLLLEQFQRLRDGDRFWYENPTMFKQEQLNEIKKTNLARILCDNGDSIDTIGENVFLLPENQDGLISCDDLPSIDFRYWVECESCSNDDNQLKRRRRRNRSVDMETIELRVTDSNDERFGKLENSQKGFTDTLETLKKRVEMLEKNCNRY